MYLESMDPGQDCLKPKSNELVRPSSATQFQVPNPETPKPVRQDTLPDTKADPMKDTGGAVVTLVTCIFQNNNNTGTDGKGSLKLFTYNIT